MTRENHSGSRHPFGYGLNTSTIRGFELGIVEEVNLIAQAGYEGVEPWIREVDAYVAAGGSLAELRQRIEDAGLKVIGGIAFPTWAVDDPNERQAGLEEAKRCMDLIKQLGGDSMAAPPYGSVADVSLDDMAQRYAQLLRLGQSMEVTPVLELWGHSPKLSRLGELLYVACESHHVDASVLLDVYHLYKGGNAFESLRLLNGQRLGLLHMNDYPAHPPRETITDADRVYPGDGVAPLGEILSALKEIGYQGMLSLELFNPAYWEGDPAETLRVGLDKTKAVVEAAFQPC